MVPLGFLSPPFSFYCTFCAYGQEKRCCDSGSAVSFFFHSIFFYPAWGKQGSGSGWRWALGITNGNTNRFLSEEKSEEPGRHPFTCTRECLCFIHMAVNQRVDSMCFVLHTGQARFMSTGNCCERNAQIGFWPWLRRNDSSVLYCCCFFHSSFERSSEHASLIVDGRALYPCGGMSICPENQSWDTER